MKVFDCFMYFDEEVILDLRLNILNEYVDYFVIVESIFTHKGEKRELKFNNKKFEKFKDKIIYLIYDENPGEIRPVKKGDPDNLKTEKYILNAGYRENGQRNHIIKGLNKASENDMILISDVDEIPNLENLDFEKIDKKIILFEQVMFYYKFNLKLPNFKWFGTKSCKMKYLKNPQWLRNIKDRNYPFYRIDTLFSKTKYSNLKFITDGGWHFSNLKDAEAIKHKLKSYLHHSDYDQSPKTAEEINKIILDKRAIYNLKADQRENKIGNGSKLEKYPLIKLPKYLQNNLDKYQEWFD